jgi:hypothetical protein
MIFIGLPRILTTFHGVLATSEPTLPMLGPTSETSEGGFEALGWLPETLGASLEKLASAPEGIGRCFSPPRRPL